MAGTIKQVVDFQELSENPLGSSIGAVEEAVSGNVLKWQVARTIEHAADAWELSGGAALV